ncbi:MAG: formamidopyrimidine-DNA glycosylase [Candidatus Poriferisodalaceae bacterium]|jgi:formamidopyrimidine-DNA glycosylase
MLELPEVEIARRDLDKDIGGRKIKAAEVLGTKKIAGGASSKKAFETVLEGRKIVSVGRRGLYLIINVGDEEVLVVNPGPGGSFRRSTPKVDVDKSTQLILSFTQGGQLRLLDEAEEMSVTLVGADDIDAAFPEFAELGFDPIDEPMSWTHFGQLLIRQNAKLKHLLMDDTFVVGLGPVYSDEILHSALLRWDRKPSALITQEIRRLYRAIVETMHNAVKQRGIVDDVFGESGGYTEYLEVYGRGGERSRHGRGEVLISKIGGQPHYYCDYQV